MATGAPDASYSSSGRTARHGGLMESLELDRISLGAIAQRERERPPDRRRRRRSSFSDTVISNSISSSLSSSNGSGEQDEADPYAHLTAHQAAIIKRQVETPERSYSFWHLLRYATAFDIFIMIIASICSIASGAAMPVMTIIFGGVQGVFQDYVALQVIDYDEFQRQMARFVLYFVYLAAGTFVATYISTVGFLYTGEHITAKLRQSYLESCLRQNIGFFDKLGAGEVAVKITADANRVQDGISEKIGLLLSSIATLITGFLIGFIISWKLTLIMSSTFVAIFFNTAIWSICIIRHSIPMTNGMSVASSLVQEMVSSIRVAIAFGSQGRLAKHYDVFLKSSQGHGFKVKAGIGMMMSFIMGLMHLNYGLGFWQGSIFLARGELELEDAITTLMAVMIGSFNVGAVGPYFSSFTDAVSTASKLLVVINRETPIDATIDTGKKPDKVKGHIQLECVKHIYPSRPEVIVMDGISLNIPAGKTTALVGASGSGKSTVVGLIERFYEPVEGRILLDGRDITTLNLRWLRQQIGLVGQEPILFSGTIFDNIRSGLVGTSYEHANERKQRAMAIKAAKNANAHEFVSQLVDGYDTKVGQRGLLLSGGQKQRIAIARAIVCNPQILLLDEATSALDTKSEDIVQAALSHVSRGRTTITIAHRLSTIMESHNIVVMSKGQIVEQGNHDQLLAMRGVYFDLVSAQQFTEEVKQSDDSEICEDDDNEKERILRSLSINKNIGTFAAGVDELGQKSPGASTENLPLASRFVDINKRGQQIIEKEPKYSFWSLLKFAGSFSKPESLLLCFALFFCIICGLANPVQSIFFAKQMTVLANMGSPLYDRWEVQGESNFWSLMFLMLGCATFLAHAIQSIAFAHTAEAMLRRVRHLSLKHILRQDVSFFDMEKNSPGALTAFLAVETTQLVNLCGTTLGNLLISITSIIGGVALSVVIGWKLALVCLSVVPLLIACGFARFYVLQKYTDRAANAYADSAAYAAENISAMRTVVSLTLEEQVAARYRDEVNTQRRQGFASVAKSGALFAASQSVLFLCLGLGFWYGSTLLATLEYDMFQFFVCLMSVIFGAQSAGSLLTFIPDIVRAKYAEAQLKVIFDRKPAIDIWETEGQDLEHVGGRLDFLNVHFRYPTRPDRPVLKGLDLTVQSGQHVALVGASGCGKSTTISLLERFYDPFLGQILIDGIDITRIHVNDYRSHIALVSQEPALFYGTIRENICMGTNDEEVSDEEIEIACRDANIYEFIMSLPDGFGTDIGSAGALLSGGQKQRIAIARAMIRRPKILLLDEATSALDSESEKVVQTALDRAAKGRTTVTIAHRLTTVQNADTIYVIDQGRVAESGTHHQLMAINGRYAELVKLQSFT